MPEYGIRRDFPKKKRAEPRTRHSLCDKVGKMKVRGERVTSIDTHVVVTESGIIKMVAVIKHVSSKGVALL